MCPSAPFSVPLDINASSTDEELVLFLGGRKVGDPVPGNVITAVSPFSTEPWNSPEDMWYLYNPEDPQSLNVECEIKVTRTGYWKSMDDLRIFTSSTVGIKTRREFYIGKAPDGNKTGWMMHEYQAEQKTHQGINKQQDYHSLCRVFLQIDERSNHLGWRNSIIADDADGDYVERGLLNPLEQENSLSSRDAINRSQMVGREQQGQPVLSGTSVTCPETDSSAEDVYATCDFSREDYLELNDLYSPETSSSSSDNSSLMSANSDEYFDADALLRDLQNEYNPRVEEEQVDCRYSVSASVKTNQVVIRPPPPGSVCSNSSSNLVAEGGTFANPMPERTRDSDPSSSAYELSHNRKASTSSKSPGRDSDQSSSSSSHGSRTSQGQGSKTVGRIAKLGKKYYCCFGSF